MLQIVSEEGIDKFGYLAVDLRFFIIGEAPVKSAVGSCLCADNIKHPAVILEFVFFFPIDLPGFS